ncbi:hypothetical protein K1719_017299 [Acacia pycnantha]|nr:hypothetical protein K1719_017299 [Acacia pycnantha]
MIRKGWGLNRGMEIHNMPEKNAYMFQFAPRVHKRLSLTFIRVRVLVNILEPLTIGFWVPRLSRNPTWVIVRYELLQNYCYDCGRIGYNSRTCKFQLDITNEDDEDTRSGSGLGTAHVKTIEDALEVYDNTWDEVVMIQKKPPSAARATHP